MRHAIVLVLCLAAVATAGSKKPAVRVIDGEAVVPGKQMLATPLIEVTALRFYDCRLERTGKPCTIISGTATSRLGHANYIVTIDIELFEIVQGHNFPGRRGTVRIMLDRPTPGTPERIVGRGPAWLTDPAKRPKAAAYTVTTTVTTWKPPKPE